MKNLKIVEKLKKQTPVSLNVTVSLNLNVTVPLNLNVNVSVGFY